ncbi:acetyltransferase [Trichosporon asahii var. asahii CBS 2479]|uniref:Acetyltransferase n=1 Tax=Trichosporon asahii var. asahii (strain ATCC 90039 / CBS 2479 / JCM 2466 / KCTC 7840 / NBRC 103889/ NCYC 2677 / UAMH 7654) TaxID=1186058 RepID=J5QPT1_TRIAS|nr:acetyltransferase [Trichosporon asahii var. asahii CBS 2479]EJT48468.1 acetyltransferase [Trichosporon asahii var. asahii CBS 2479]
MVQLRSAALSDHPSIMMVWRRSVEATHDFLTAADVDRIAQAVPTYLDHVRLTVAIDDDRIVGFIGSAVPDASASAPTTNSDLPTDCERMVSIEMLFVDPSAFGRGIGTQLLEDAAKGNSTVLVDVNEQNPAALGFYKSRGFAVVGRSERDTQGDPFPLLHLKRDNQMTQPRPGMAALTELLSCEFWAFLSTCTSILTRQLRSSTTTMTSRKFHFVSKTSNWHCTQVTSPATPVPGSHIVGSFDLSFTGEMQGKAHCTLVMTAYGKQLANGHKPNDFAGQAYFTGKLGGAEGSIAINQVGIFDGKRMVSTWTFLPETGTGQLEGLTGTTELEGSDPTPGAFEGAVEATFA